MSEVDDYLAGLDEPRRSTLEEVRRRILTIIPEAEEGIAYGAPVFRVGGVAVAGFAAFARHLSYLPHSGVVLTALAEEVSGYATSKGALRFGVDAPLPTDLLRTLIEARLAEVGQA